MKEKERKRGREREENPPPPPSLLPVCSCVGPNPENAESPRCTGQNDAHVERKSDRRPKKQGGPAEGSGPLKEVEAPAAPRMQEFHTTCYESPNAHIRGSRPQKKTSKFHEKTPRVRQDQRNWLGRGKSKTQLLGGRAQEGPAVVSRGGCPRGSSVLKADWSGSRGLPGESRVSHGGWSERTAV